VIPTDASEVFNVNEKIQEVDRQALSIAEVSSVSGLGRTKIYEAIAAGTLKARKCGKRTLILPDDLREFLTNLPQA
jgi:excisionase family DNA binding protein